MLSVQFNNNILTPSKVVCVGRNFPLHIKEMTGKESRPPEPTIFLKPNSAIACDCDEILVPKSFGSLHYEVELAFIVGKDGKNINERKANNYIIGYAVAVDLTLRDLQSRAKQSGMPWAISKGFDYSAPLGKFVSADQVSNPNSLDMMLMVNDEVRQHGNTKDMIFSPPEILAYTSRFMTIEKGDVFLCGTPQGVGEIKEGDILFAEISGLPALKFKVSR